MSSNDETVCYTNDGLIVFTLYVKNIISEKTRKDVKDYFLTFGEITSVIFSETVGNYSAFVTFKNTGDAARALWQPNHSSFSNEIQVEWADMWHQPEAAFEFSLNLLDLNDDCLLQIIPYLNSLEKIRFSLTCQRFRAHYEYLLQFGEMFYYNDVITKITVPEMTEFFSRSGQHIRRIVCEYPIEDYINYIELLPTYCNNLEDIEFRMMTEMPFGPYSRIFRANGNLKKVSLIQCFYITDKLYRQISRLTQLKSLNLSDNYKFTGKHLNKIKSLIDLTLKGTGILSEPFVDLCNSVQLKTLNIVGCNLLTAEAYQALVDTQSQLERIVVSDTDQGTGSELVAQITNLKHVEIMHKTDTNLLADLVVHKRDSLESLSIYGKEMSQITKDGILQFRNIQKLSFFHTFDLQNTYVDHKFLLEIAQNCTELREFICPGASALKEIVLIDFIKFGINLEKVNVSKWNLSNGVYEKLVAVLKGRKVKPMRPVELNVHEAGISTDILRTEKYRMNRNLLKLSFVNHPRSNEDYTKSFNI